MINFWLPIPPVASCDWQKCMNPDMIVWFNLASIPYACCIMYQFRSTNIIVGWTLISSKDTHVKFLHLWSLKWQQPPFERSCHKFVMIVDTVWCVVLAVFENHKLIILSSFPFRCHNFITIDGQQSTFDHLFPFHLPCTTFHEWPFNLHLFMCLPFLPSLHGYWKCRKWDAEFGWLMTATFSTPSSKRCPLQLHFLLSKSLSICYAFIFQNFNIIDRFSSSLVIFITYSIRGGGCFYQKMNVRVCYPATAQSGQRNPELSELWV